VSKIFYHWYTDARSIDIEIMVICEFCLTDDTQLVSFSPSEMEKRTRGQIQISKRVVTCDSCVSDLLTVSRAFDKWQNRVGISTCNRATTESDDGSTSLAIIGTQPVNTSLKKSRKRVPQFSCPHCHIAPLKDESALTTHEMLHHRCFRCSSIFPDKHRLQSHSRDCLREMQVICPACHLRFESESRLSSHMSEVHPALDLSVACDRCDMRFASKTSLRAHAHAHVHNLSEAFCGTSEDSVNKKARGNNESEERRLVKTYLKKDSG